jgi:Uma2 family endonuclease
MSTTLVSIAEYLDTAYSPDREFINGVILERHLGERPDSLVQKNIIILLDRQAPNLFVWPEQRVRTKLTRTRIPDVCVTAADPELDVFDTPPLICVEILCRRDEMTDVLEKLEEYAEFGVQEIWLIDPRRLKAFRYEKGLVPVSALTFPAAGIELSLADVFRGL